MSALDDIAWYNTLLQTEGKTCDFVVFDELIEADSEEGGAEMSERREFVKVERMGDKARYSVEIPITTETIHDRMDKLEQRVDGNAEQIRKDWNAHFRQYGYMEERLTEVEERIKAMERRLNRKSMDSPGESLKIDGESLKNGGGE